MRNFFLIKEDFSYARLKSKEITSIYSRTRIHWNDFKILFAHPMNGLQILK